MGAAISGVYVITNTVTGEQYVGYSGNINARIRQHGSKLRKGKHQSRLLQAAWDEHGESAFEVKVLENVPNYMDLDRAEARWIATLKPAYNRLRPVPLGTDAIALAL